MAEPKYYLTQRDRDKAAAYAASVARGLIGTQGHSATPVALAGPPGPLMATPAVYVAVPPCGVGIPARIGALAGAAVCCIFRLMAPATTTTPAPGTPYTPPPYTLAPVLYSDGTPLTAAVYNIYDTAWPPLLPPNERYIHIDRDKYGRWLCEPYGGLGAPTTTTTTTPPGPMPCGNGRCRWVWDGTVWGLAAGCQTTTTSTTATTGGSSTTTTASPCLCGTPPTTTTTTTACNHCYYPMQCGTSVGQCAHTPCATVDAASVIKIPCTTSTTSTTNTTPTGYTTTSTTTTTSCDCNTTSTAGCCPSGFIGGLACGGPTDNGGFNCQWLWNGTTWLPTWQNCDDCVTPATPVSSCAGGGCPTYVSYCGQCITNRCICPCCGSIDVLPAPTEWCPQRCMPCNWSWGGGGGGGGIWGFGLSGGWCF